MLRAEDNQELLPRRFAARPARALAPVVASRASFLPANLARLFFLAAARAMDVSPPPARADQGNFSAGYDPYDRFDLGSPVYDGLSSLTSHFASLTALHVAQTSSAGKTKFSLSAMNTHFGTLAPTRSN